MDDPYAKKKYEKMVPKRAELLKFYTQPGVKFVPMVFALLLLYTQRFLQNPQSLPINHQKNRLLMIVLTVRTNKKKHRHSYVSLIVAWWGVSPPPPPTPRHKFHPSTHITD